MAAARDAEVVIGARPDLAAGLSETTKQIDQWARQTQQVADKGGNSLRDFVREQRRDQRMASYFVREMADVVPISAQWKGAMTNVGAELIGGSPFMLGMAGATIAVGFLVRAMMEQSRAAEEALKKTQEFAKGVHDELVRNIEQVILLQAQASGGSLGVAEAKSALAREAAAKREVEAYRELTAARAAMAEAEDRMQNGFGWAGYADTSKRLAVAEKAFTDAVKNSSEVVKRTDLELTSARAEAGRQQTANAQKQWDQQVAGAKKAGEDMKKALVAAHAPDTSGQATVAGFFALESSTYDPAASARQELQAFNEAMREGRSIYESTRTPAEAYNAELARLSNLLEMGTIDQDTFARAVERAGQAYVAAQQQARQFIDVGVSGFFDLVGAAAEGGDAIVRVWQNIASQLIGIFQRIASEWIASQILGTGLQALGAVGGSGGVAAPELIPMGSGKIGAVGAAAAVPASGGKAANITISAIDSQSFKEYLARNQGVLAGQITELAYKGRV